MSAECLIGEPIGQLSPHCFCKLRLDVLECESIVRGALQRFIDHSIWTHLRSKKPCGNTSHHPGSVCACALVGHGGRGSNADGWCLVWCAAVPQPTDKDGHVRSLAPPIGMELIKDNELQPLGMVDDFGVQFVLPGQQQFSHHEVGQQNIGRLLRNALALLLAFLTRVAPHDGLQGLRETGLGNKSLNLIDLAIGKGIHGIDNDGPRPPRLMGLAGTDDGIHNGDEEAERLARPGSRGHHIAFAPTSFGDGLSLVLIQRTR